MIAPSSTWKPITNISGLVCFNKEQNILFRVEKNGLFKYSSNTSKWVQQHSFNDNTIFKMIKFCNIRYIPIASTGSKIYIYYPNKSMIVINPDNGSMKIHESSIRIGKDVKVISIDNEFHMIGGGESNKHLKWNNKMLECEILHDLKKDINWDKIGHHQLIRIHDKILSFGGFSWELFRSLDKVYEYGIISRKWIVTGVKLPSKLHDFGCVKVFNGQYVILFGGAKGLHNYGDDIWIFCIKKKNF